MMNQDFDRNRVGYCVTTTAIEADRPSYDHIGDREVMVGIGKLPPNESGPPYYWEKGYGIEFETAEEAFAAAKSAWFTSWSFKSVDTKSFVVRKYQIRTVRETTFLGLVKEPK